MNRLCKCIYLQLSCDFFSGFATAESFGQTNFSSRLRFFLIFSAQKSVLSCWSGCSPGGCVSNLIISQRHMVKAVISDFKCSRQMHPGELKQEMELRYRFLGLDGRLRWVQLSIMFDKMKMKMKRAWTHFSVIGSAYEDRNIGKRI